MLTFADLPGVIGIFHRSILINMQTRWIWSIEFNFIRS